MGDRKVNIVPWPRGGPLDLGTVGIFPIDFALGSFVVEEMTGAAGTVFLSESPQGNDPNAIELTDNKGHSWAQAVQMYVHVRTATTGGILKLTIAGPGMGISPGNPGGAASLNRIDWIAGKVTFQFSDGWTALGSSLAVPGGYGLAIKADLFNTKYVDIRCLNHTGGLFRLHPGESISLQISNIALVECLAPDTFGDQTVHWAAEQ